jgi:hypothetical protein
VKISAKLQTPEGKVISEAVPFERESDGAVPTVIQVPIVVGRFRQRRLHVVVRIEP